MLLKYVNLLSFPPHCLHDWQWQGVEFGESRRPSYPQFLGKVMQLFAKLWLVTGLADCMLLVPFSGDWYFLLELGMSAVANLVVLYCWHANCLWCINDKFLCHVRIWIGRENLNIQAIQVNTGIQRLVGYCCTVLGVEMLLLKSHAVVW